jgi:hypothetical protein
MTRHRPRRESDPTEPRISVRNATLQGLSADGLVLSCELRTSMLVPTGAESTWDARVVMVGSFQCVRQLSDEEAAFFSRTSGLFVMWPFARATLDALARFASVSAPQLPLLVRPGATPVSSGRSR